MRCRRLWPYIELDLEPCVLHSPRMCRVSSVFRCACTLPLEHVEALALRDRMAVACNNGRDVQLGTGPSCRDHHKARRDDGIIPHGEFCCGRH
jgi:hypothetical protein